MTAELEREGGVRFLIALGFPAFGLAVASTVVTTYLPLFIERLSGPALTGLLIGTEGFVGLFLPGLIGGWSDSTGSRFGSRMPFVVVATVGLGVTLVLIPLLGSLVPIALGLIAFFVAYFTYYAPYRALYPDLVDPAARGRAVGIQGTWRSAGLGVGMAGGGVMLALWQPLPFLVAAVALAAGTLLLVAVVGRDDPGSGAGEAPQGEGHSRLGIDLLRERRDITALLAANTLWEFTVAALKTFVVLFFTVGLGRSLGFVSIVLGTVAAAAVVAAPLSGWAGDRLGQIRVIKVALLVFGIGLLLPVFTISPLVFPLIAVVAFAAVVLITLPYSVLMSVIPAERNGAASGLFELSRAGGTLLGPLTAGITIELLQPYLPVTHGYVALFAVSSAAMLASYPVVRRFERLRVTPEAERGP